VKIQLRPVSRGLAIAVGFALPVAAGCALTSGTLGGREKCWPESDQRVPSLWRGTLRIDASGGRLDTPEGDVIPLLPGTLGTRVGESGIGELVRGSDIMAIAGEDVTLFGGAGADGALVVCAVEEIHSPSE
jgi:hypothetical protein